MPAWSLKAQDKVYSPPPMFGTPLTDVPESTETNPNTAIKTSDTDHPKPLPKEKPAVPDHILESIRKQQTEQNRQGVVTGPKTMPAIPVDDFDAETLYRDENGKIQGAILQRHLNQVKEQQSASMDEETQPQLTNTPLPGIGFDVHELQDGQAQKIVVAYQSGQEKLQTALSQGVQARVKATMTANPTWRMQIMSYATAFDEGQSSDRRMALNRALDLREGFLKNGIEASRLDVRAMGQNTSEDLKDRVDLVLYNPTNGLPED